MIYSGGGVVLSGASAQLTELVRLLGFPCTNTLMGLGAYPASDKQFVGMPGMHGTYEACMSMQYCDVLLAVGARFDDRVIGNVEHFAQVPRKIIHIDIDPSSIAKRVKVDVPVVGDLKLVLEQILSELRSSKQKPDASDLAAWWKQVNEWRVKGGGLRYKNSTEIIKPQFVIEKPLRDHRRRCLRHFGCRPASDVGGAVLQVQQAATLDQLRRPGHDGLWFACRNGRATDQSRCNGRLRHRRGQYPDEHPGAFHLQTIPPADQGGVA